jgi:methylated-DNA-[protein]-cysteine S-methyltransferase
VELDTRSAPPFLLRVQRAAQTIPAGETRTYGELAALADSPRAVRAAGRAMATNPWPILVPCHRIVARAGFGEYSAGSGVHTKLRLLWREGYRGRTSNVSFGEHEAVAHLRNADPRLGKLIDRVGPFTLQVTAPKARGGPPPFAALASAIIAQQLSGKAAATIYGRVAALLGQDDVDDPAALFAQPKPKLRSAGLSQNKMLALLDLAAHALDRRLPTRAEMEAMSDAAIIERLTQIRGIGSWSAQMLLMFYLGRQRLAGGRSWRAKGIRHHLPSPRPSQRKSHRASRTRLVALRLGGKLVPLARGRNRSRLSLSERSLESAV